MAYQKERTEFYNAKQKERYLLARETESTNKNIRLVMRTFFAASAKYEFELEKDCSNFTIREISDMFAGQMSPSISWLENFNSQMSIYTAWCLSENLVNDHQNHYMELSKDDLRGFLNLALKENSIISRNELLKLSSEFPNVSDVFITLAIFEGLGGGQFSDFYQLGLDNINGNLISVGNRQLSISNKLIELAEESAKEYNKYTRDGATRGYKQTDDGIVKDSANAGEQTIARNQRKIYMRLYELEKEFGKVVGYNALHNSGRIEFIKNLMKADGSNDAKATYAKHRDDIEYRYGSLYTDWAEWIDDHQKYLCD